jgi:hypothetical protein
MRIVTIHEAKIHLSRLLERGDQRRALYHCKSRQAVVTVIKIDTTEPIRRTDFLAGRFPSPTISIKWAARLFNGDLE